MARVSADFPTYVTPGQAADLLPRFDADWVRQQCRSGLLRASYVGGRYLIKLEDLEDFLEQHVIEASPQPDRAGLSARQRRRGIGLSP